MSTATPFASSALISASLSPLAASWIGAMLFPRRGRRLRCHRHLRRAGAARAEVGDGVGVATREAARDRQSTGRAKRRGRQGGIGRRWGGVTIGIEGAPRCTRVTGTKASAAACGTAAAVREVKI